MRALSSAPAAQQPPDEKAEALMQELSHDLMSPYCPGRTIATCPSPNARKLEQQILAQAREGKTREEIEQSLVSRFPDIIGYVGDPRLIWGTVVGGLVALVLLVVVARRWVRRAGTPAQPVAAASPDAAALARPGGPAAAAGKSAPSQREFDALDDALDRVDEF